jgi:cyclic pyranopterin phosphate synthase
MDPIKPLSNHFDPGGNARMVDVTAKPITTRTATAKGCVVMRPETAAMIREGTAKKGDVLTIARIAAISATKLTPMLIPLCHGISVEAVDVRFDFEADNVDGAKVVATDGGDVTLCCEVDVRSSGKTGVEMEALTAVMAGCLTVYDMCKSVDRGMTIQGVRVIAKSGGASGDFFAP